MDRKMITLRLPLKVLAKLDRLASEMQINRTAYICQLIIKQKESNATR